MLFIAASVTDEKKAASISAKAASDEPNNCSMDGGMMIQAALRCNHMTAENKTSTKDTTLQPLSCDKVNVNSVSVKKEPEKHHDKKHR